MDRFHNHLFISLIVLALESEENEHESGLTRVSVDDDSRGSTLSMRTKLFQRRKSAYEFMKGVSGVDPNSFKRPEASIAQCNLFYLPAENTVISIFQRDGHIITSSLYSRLANKLLPNRQAQDPSFLMYSIIDSIVDHYFPILEVYTKQINSIDELVNESPRSVYTKALDSINRELSVLKKTLQPTGSVLTTLRNSDSIHESQDVVQEHGFPSISKRTKVYLGDVLDHVNIIMDNLASLEGDSKALIDLIFNTISHSTNETMRSLAVLSLIFLPTTFLAGVYGMNFDNFPELHFDLGFAYFWLLFLLAVIVTVMTAWKFGWLRRI